MIGALEARLRSLPMPSSDASHDNALWLDARCLSPATRLRSLRTSDGVLVIAMIIGTAGHIDHGKTSLIKRLTGRDTDRLPEEIKRGISIELGYAYVPVDDVTAETGDEVLGFVDVPGHERFVHTMLAGATGIDFALLVVAADDGVMPQTDEHLDILLTLGVTRRGDRPDQDRCRSRRAASTKCAPELAERVRATPAADWPLFPVSSLTGEGIGALDAHLRDAARDHRLRACRWSFSTGDRPLFHTGRCRHHRDRHRAAMGPCASATASW